MKILSTLFISCLLMATSALAGPAEEYGKANRSQQAQLLQQWAQTPDASRLTLLQALNRETVVMDTQGQLFSQQQGTLTPLEGDAAPAGATKKCL